MPGYDRRWQRHRANYLRGNPLCVMCHQLGRIEPATVVDHVTPHKGDYSLFWDVDNHQSLCKPCHDRHKQRQDRTGMLAGCDVSGIPVDSKHHWNN